MRLSTERLELRPWVGADLAVLSEINADPEVNGWLGGPAMASHTAASFAAMQERLEVDGWGVLAVCDAGGELLGLAGLQPVRASLPFAPAVEAVWRLKRSAWGCGYAVEAMTAMLADVRRRRLFDEIVALVAEPNLRSAATARRLGFVHRLEQDFLHPALAEDHPLRPHRVFELSP